MGKQILYFLMAFEVIEGFFAILAFVERLAGCAAEFADQRSMKRIASRTLDRLIAVEHFAVADLLERIGRRDAESL